LDTPTAEEVGVGVLEAMLDKEMDSEDRAVIVTVMKFERVALAIADEAALVEIPRCSEDAELGKENKIGTVDILIQLFGVF
jgi:hypothetical protein